VIGWLLYFAFCAIAIISVESRLFAAVVLLIALNYAALRWWHGLHQRPSNLPPATMTRRQRRRLKRERLDLNTAHRGRWS
jgi:hypothetical protein